MGTEVYISVRRWSVQSHDVSLVFLPIKIRLILIVRSPISALANQLERFQFLCTCLPLMEKQMVCSAQAWWCPVLPFLSETSLMDKNTTMLSSKTLAVPLPMTLLRVCEPFPTRGWRLRSISPLRFSLTRYCSDFYSLRTLIGMVNSRYTWHGCLEQTASFLQTILKNSYNKRRLLTFHTSLVIFLSTD